MPDVSVNGVPHQQTVSSSAEEVSSERLRTIVQDAHLNFLIGAGTPSEFFGLLGNVEEALTDLARSTADDTVKSLVRASIQAYFFDSVLLPNLKVLDRSPEARSVLTSYAEFLKAVNRVLLKRHSSILAKHANIFTTNVDMVFEVTLEQMGIDYSDGFSGKIRPRFDLSDYNTVRLRMASRFEQRSEVPVFNIVKLHGSAAWLQESHATGRIEIIFDHQLSMVKAVLTALNQAREVLIPIREPGEVNATALMARAAPAVVVPESVQEFAAAYEKLGIVNPDKQKFATTVLNQTYYELIRRFANELEKENSVLFVHGFSFRDEHLRDVVVRSARSNPTLQVFVFCYTRSSLNEYRELIPDTDIRNSNIFFIVPAEPADAEPEQLASLDVVTSKYFTPIVADQFSGVDKRIELDIRFPTGGGADV